LPKEVGGADHLAFPLAEALPPGVGGGLSKVPAPDGVVGEDDAVIGKIRKGSVVAEVRESDRVHGSHSSSQVQIVRVGGDVDGQILSLSCEKRDREEASSVDPVPDFGAIIADIGNPLGMVSRENVARDMPTESSLAVLSNPLPQLLGAGLGTLLQKGVKHSLIRGVGCKGIWTEFC